MTVTVEVENEEQTRQISAKIAPLLQAGDVILLEGELGAGKTTFTKGLAKGLGIESVIRSPTYTLIREYTKGRLPLYHMDVYRLEQTGGSDLGLDEYIYGKGVSVIEWAAFIKEDLPADFLKIKITLSGDSLEKRRLTFEPSGARYEALTAAIKNILK